jgi:hypothetical protein
MLEKKEYRGYFYTPETPDKKISGILYFYPNEKIQLELIGGCLSGENNGFSCRQKDLNAIFGVVRTENGATKITLLNCYGSGWKSHNNIQNCEICLTNYSCSYLILGKHLADKENKAFNKIRVSFPCFNDWYRENQIQFDLENKFTNIFKTTKDSKNPKRIQLNEKETIRINGFSSSHDISRHEKCLYEKSYIELENTDKSRLFDLLVNIGWFRDFYSFAAMTSMPFSEIYLYYNDDSSVIDGTPYTHPVMLFFVAEEKFEKKDKFSGHHFLFDFQKIENNFETIMQKWYEKKENGEPIIQQLISSVTYHRFIKSSDFLIVIQAIEGYYNRFVKEMNLKSLLEDLYDKFNDIHIIASNKPNLDQVVDSRHYYSHILPEGKKENVCKGFELYGLAEKLKPLLIGCVLTLIGFQNKEINDLLAEYYSWERSPFITL